ncbi:MAG: DMT family transporter [Rhodospirillales bacterium]|nr:DMT family transporter [Rhodospirillales bacterium]
MTSNAAPASNATGISSRRNLQEGILLMVIGMLILPGIDAIAKGLSGSISSGQVTWSRFFFQTLLLLPFVLRAGGLRVGRRLWVHAARGFLIALATLLFFTALGELPLADAISIFFVEPFILTLLSALLLGESIGWRRLFAVFVGFCGALVIIRPSYAVFGMTALLPMGAAVSFALYVVLTRWLVREGSAVTMQFYAGVFGCLTMTAALWFGLETRLAILMPVWPGYREWLLLAVLGVIATAGHMLVVQAIRRVGASMVAPFQYLEIISATILGLVFFGDFPDATTWLGVAIIIGSGLFVFFRERRLAAEQDSLATQPLE